MNFPLGSSLFYTEKIFLSCTLENVEVSFANILQRETIPSGKSFVYMRNKRGLNREPWGILESFFFQMSTDHLVQLFITDCKDNFLTI